MLKLSDKMKFLQKDLSGDFSKANVKFVGMLRDIDAESTDEARINHILESPGTLSLRDLKYVESHVDELDSAERSKFVDLLGYHFSLVGNESLSITEAIVPRMFYQIR